MFHANLIPRGSYGVHPIYIEHRFNSTTSTSQSHGVFLLKSVFYTHIQLLFFEANLNLTQPHRLRHPPSHPPQLYCLSHSIPHPRRHPRLLLPRRPYPFLCNRTILFYRRHTYLAAVLGLRVPSLPLGLPQPRRGEGCCGENARCEDPAGDDVE